MNRKTSLGCFSRWFFPHHKTQSPLETRYFYSAERRKHPTEMWEPSMCAQRPHWPLSHCSLIQAAAVRGMGVEFSLLGMPVWRKHTLWIYIHHRAAELGLPKPPPCQAGLLPKSGLQVWQGEKPPSYDLEIKFPGGEHRNSFLFPSQSSFHLLGREHAFQ